MTIFVIQQMLASGPGGALHEAISEKFPFDSYQIATGAWLISANSTAKALSDSLGISEGERGSGLVTEMASYFGRADPAIWSWIKTKWEGQRVG